jgi:hypothetical protein
MRVSFVMLNWYVVDMVASGGNEEPKCSGLSE